MNGPFIATDGMVLKTLVLADQGLAVKEKRSVWGILPAGRRAPNRARRLIEFLARHLRAVLPSA